MDDESDFKQPVKILVGLGYVKEIGSVMEAYAFLNDWVAVRSRTEHAAALNACKAVLAGREDAERAFALFRDFAESQHLLAPDSTFVAAAKSKDALARRQV